MNFAVVLVGLGEPPFFQEQSSEAVGVAQLKFVVHLDRLERANLHANLAAHADRNIDVERRRIKLRLADVIGFLVLALLDENALRRTFLLANLAGDTAQAGLRIGAVENEKRKLTRGFFQWDAFFGILDGRETRFVGITTDEIPRRLFQTLQDSGAEHGAEFTN